MTPSGGPAVDERYAAWMGLALDLAARAARDGDVPVGAVVISPAGEVIGEGRNLREVEGDPTAHAEVVALRAAARSVGEWRLEDCTLVVTLEPCPMCAGALMLSRISRLVLGAWDPKLGATGSVWDLVRDRRATHRVEVIGGVRASECSQVLLTFFEEQRAAGRTTTPGTTPGTALGTSLGTALGTAAETAQGDGRVAGA